MSLSPAHFLASPPFLPLRFRLCCVNIHHVTLQNPTIIPRSEHSISRRWISPNALRVLYRLKETGYYAYLVGGGVRDLLLGREPHDFDIVTDAKPSEMKKLFRNCRLIGRRFRLAHVHFQNEIIEVATFRSNSTEDLEREAATPRKQQAMASLSETQTPELEPRTAGRQGAAALEARKEEPPLKPRPPRMLKTADGIILRDNVFGTPEEDALRRDFTVNALFYNIADFSVIDYVDGMDDLRKGLIRIIGNPLVRFTEDPVRMVRAVRFAATLGFEIEKNTYQAILELKDKIAMASPSRMYEEVLKLFLLGEGEKTYQLLRQTGLFGAIFPRLSEWVDMESDSFPHVWIGKAFDWVDNDVQSKHRATPHILFALLFGQYIEERMNQRRKSGTPALEAVTSVVAETLAEQAQRVIIPKKVGLAMRDLYWNQRRFEKREGEHPSYFLRRPGFDDAFEYLRFYSDTTEEKKGLCLWWKEFIKTSPPRPAAGHAETKGSKQVGKNHHKKRRRRHKSKHEEPKLRS
jgi:poly(A) polymerase